MKISVASPEPTNRQVLHQQGIDRVRALRAEGLTLAEIAQLLGRSITWVNCRLNPLYAVSRTNRCEAPRRGPDLLLPDLELQD